MFFVFLVSSAIFLFFLQFYSYLECKNAVTRFADQFVSMTFLKLKTFLGVNLRSYFPFPSEFDQAPAIVMFVSPSCDICHFELESILAQKRRADFSFPFLCFVEREDRNYDNFIKEFGNQLPLIPADKETLVELQISSFPSLFIIDSNGVIRYPGHFFKEIISVLQDRRKMARYRIQ